MNHSPRSFTFRTLCTAFCLWACLASIGLAQEGTWAPPEPTYTIEGTTITANDGGKSQGDHYLLSARDLSAFVLDFDLVRVSARAPRDRAMIVFNVDEATRKNRACMWLSSLQLPIGEPAHFRLVVVGDKCVLYRDGKPAGQAPQIVGAPKPPGRVGFLHYYDYDYRYEHVKLVPLEGGGLQAVGDLKAELLKGGAVRLTWTVPELFRDLLTYRVHRAEGADCQAIEETAVGKCEGASFLDVRTRAKRSYAYRVCAVGSDGRSGPPSNVACVEVKSVQPPAPPMEFRVVQRISGSARLCWRIAPESRAETIDLFASEKPMTSADAKGSQPVAANLPPVNGTRLAPPSKARYYAIRINDPDGVQLAFLCKESEPTAPLVSPDMKFPDKHPYLEMTVDDIRAVREKAEREEWAKRAYKGILSWADKMCEKEFTIPAVDESDKHRSASCTLRRMGQAYALSGDEKYAAYVKNALLAYADLYPKLPVRDYRHRVTQYSLMEATWYHPLIIAYDYIHDSPALTAENKAHIEKDLLRLACELFKVDDYATDPRRTDLHFKCYNFQAWFIACTGMTGLCLRDADLVDYAIDSPYGFKHLVTHDVRDDGIFWERSLGYHSFVQSALEPFLESAYHCNIDLYHLQVPDDMVKDRESIANYVVDGDNGPKSIKLMYDGPFYFTFPDLTFPVYADSSRGPLAPSDRYRIAWLRYRDPKYAWLLCREAKPPAEWRGPKDVGASAWLGWDESSLYVCADVKDDVVRNMHTDPSRWWSGDGVWLGLKFTDRAEKEYDFIYFIDPGDFAKAKPVLALFNRYAKAQNGPSAGKLDVKKTSDGYEARAIIPLSEIAPKAGETGAPLTPREGMTITFDVCLYDGDLTSGDSEKQKMVGWSSRLDRYDTDEGGVLVFGPAAEKPDGKGKPVAVAQRRTQPLRFDATIEEWKKGTVPITIGDPQHVMFDNPPGKPGESLFYDPPSPAEGRFEIGTGRFANNGVAMRDSTLFPSSGFAVLREERPNRNARCVVLSYGPHGGGHGHSDMLSIVLYAFGQHVIPDFGSCEYGSKEKNEWTAQTVSHNTVVVDEISQYPTGDRDVQWPCDSAEQQAKGSLDFFHAGPLLKIVRARSDAVYQGVELARTLVLFDGNVLDLFDVSSEKEHTYDYVLHVDGESPTCGIPLRPQKGPLGTRCGYQWLTNVRRATTDGETAIAFEGKEKFLLTVRMFPAAGAEIILADGITNKVDQKMPTLLARRKGKSTSFAAVLSSSSIVMPVGPPEVTRVGERAFISEDRFRHVKTYLFAPRAPGEATWDKFWCTALAAAFREEGGVLKADMVKAARCKLGEVAVQLSAPANLFLSASAKSIEIETGIEADGTISIKGVPGAAQVQERVSADKTAAVPCSNDGGALSFALRPLTRYEVRW